MFLKPSRVLACIFVCTSVLNAQSSELTINKPPDLVGSQIALIGKAPSPNSKVFVVINPVDTPQQFWVQKMATVDGRKNWISTVHIGDPGPAHRGQQFVIRAVADSDKELHEGDVLSDWPKARWLSQPVVVTRK